MDDRTEEKGARARGNLTGKLLLAAVIVAFFVAFWAFDLARYVSLPYLKESSERLKVIYAGHRPAVILVYFLVYVITTSLSLPGAAVLTIAGGALFGLFTGTIIVSFASALGATIACFVSRFLLRDWVQGKFGDKIAKVNEGIEKEGAFYLFTLRLIPIFPFWVINLVMGLTGMTLWRFYLVSQVGMLPGTIVYVNAGRELAKIESLKGILSPGLLISFALLGLFPIGVKKVVALLRARRERNGGDGLKEKGGSDGKL